MSKTLRKKLKSATVEKDVESAYRAELSTERPYQYHPDRKMGVIH